MGREQLAAGERAPRARTEARLSTIVAMAAPLLLLLLPSCKRAPQPSAPRTLPRTRQLVVVRTADWTASKGTLQRYARGSATAAWSPVAASVPVVVGRAGLAWGRGVLPEQSGPQKREGDDKAPAGLFRLTATFGESAEPPGNLAHTEATKDILCIDDPASLRYNRILNKTEVQYPDWKSFEALRRQDNQYKLGIVVEHNREPVVPAAGSCIFLHIWQEAAQPTDGCTAMDAAPLEALAHWLDWIAEPILVQLPEPEYLRLRTTWGLP